MTTIVETLKAIVGEENVLLGQAQRAQKAVDLYAIRLYQRNVGWKPTLPQAVVCPTSTDQVSKVLKACYEKDIPVIPRGGGSSVVGGCEVRNEEVVVVDLSKMKEIKNLDQTNLKVSLEAGLGLEELENWLNERGYTTGHFPQSIGQAEMGGLVATRSAGQFSTGYGNIEDLLLGLEAVLPDGKVVRIKSTPRRSTGPDLRNIFMGSEGAFGIITEVTVKVYPKPNYQWKESYRLESMRQGIEIARKILRSGAKPQVLRIHDWLECEKPYGAFMEEDECLMILLVEGEKALVDAQAEIISKIAKEDGAISAGSKPVDIWYEHRNDAADEYEVYGSQGILVDTIEVSGTWSDLADIYEKTIERVYYEVPEVLFFSGHSSHSYMTGSNIYFQLGAYPKADIKASEEVYMKVWSIVMEEILKYEDATISHHHGIGKQRTSWLKEELGSSYSLLKAMKKAFDPKGLMNPGTLLEKE